MPCGRIGNKPTNAKMYLNVSRFHTVPAINIIIIIGNILHLSSRHFACINSINTKITYISF